MSYSSSVFVKQHQMKANKNIFGDPLVTCGKNPLTGYFRNGCCDTDISDYGLHTVCVIVTNEFLEFSKSVGNDLSTPIPHYGFEGLKDGDRWCLCAIRWREAMQNNVAPKVILEATNEDSLKVIDINDLIKYSHV